MFMAALAPLAVTRVASPPAWDDAYFLDRAVCVHRAAYALSPSGVWKCIGSMFKSPVMALLLLPAGPPTGGDAILGVATYLLAAATLGFAAALAWMTWRAGAPFWAAALASVALASCAPLQSAEAPFLVDGPYAIFIALVLGLPALELGAPAAAGRPAILRGCLWGALFGWGLLLKATFLFFAALAVPLLLFVSLSRTGARATRDKGLSAMVVALPPVIVFIRFRNAYLENALRSSFGEGARFYGPDQHFWTSLAQQTASTGLVYWLVCAGLLAGAIILARRDLPRLLITLASCAIALAYLLVVSFSRNEQSRFLWCVWVAAPTALACASATRPAAPRRAVASTAWIAVLIALAALPMFSRFDGQNLRKAEAILRALNTGGTMRIEIADDPQFLNNNTFQLARQIDWPALNRIDVSTVVYQQAEGKSLAFSLERLRTADFVLFLQPASSQAGPDFTNGLNKTFLDFARACGQPAAIGEAAGGALIFDMRKAATCVAPADR